MADEELERRVKRLESRMDEESGLPAEVRKAREDAAAARHLAAAGDRDVADLHLDLGAFRRATSASFSAMRADLNDLRGEVNDLRGEVNDLRGEMRAGFATVDGKFEQTAAGMQQITTMLTILIERDDRPRQ